MYVFSSLILEKLWSESSATHWLPAGQAREKFTVDGVAYSCLQIVMRFMET